EQRDDGESIAAERAAQIGGVENPHVGTPDAGRRELRVEWAVLAAMRGGDEGPGAAWSGEDQITRLVTDQECAHDARWDCCNVDDPDTVGKVVPPPPFGIAACGAGDRLHAEG